MKRLDIQKIAPVVDAAKIGEALDAAGVRPVRIAEAPWAAEWPYRPEVSLRIAHSGIQILIEYSVEEDSVAALAHDMGHVWEDSCCEFFCMPQPEDGLYYNLECNCTANVLLCCGPEREGREPAPDTTLFNIRRWASLGRGRIVERKEHTAWKLSLILPVQTFFRHHLRDLTGRTMRANFYKCGDRLMKPHFLAWNPIDIAKPDFHRPDFFGEIHFL